jgi:hypothetical protein
MLAEKTHLVTRQAALTLHARSHTWPPDRQRALAGHLRKIVTDAIQAQR